MNRQEKIIAILLGLVLAGWLWYTVNEQKKQAEARRAAAVQQAKAPAKAPVAKPAQQAAAKPAEARSRPSRRSPRR